MRGGQPRQCRVAEVGAEARAEVEGAESSAGGRVVALQDATGLIVRLDDQLTGRPDLLGRPEDQEQAQRGPSHAARFLS